MDAVTAPTDAELVGALGRACARLAERDDSRTMTLRFVLQQVGMSDPSVVRVLHEELTQEPETGKEQACRSD